MNVIGYVGMINCAIALFHTSPRLPKFFMLSHFTFSQICTYRVSAYVAKQFWSQNTMGLLDTTFLPKLIFGSWIYEYACRILQRHGKTWHILSIFCDIAVRDFLSETQISSFLQAFICLAILAQILTLRILIIKSSKINCNHFYCF